MVTVTVIAVGQRGDVYRNGREAIAQKKAPEVPLRRLSRDGV
jgi:hypothetical protein